MSQSSDDLPMSENPYLMTMPQLISAKKKIGQIAAYYDPAKSSFRGFDASALTPTEFREQLRRNFLVRLTDQELGAIVLLFDKDGDGEVDSTEFINEFFRLGKQEKTKFFLKKKALDATLQKAKAKAQAEHEAKFVELATPKFPETWTKEEERNAVRKVAKVAFTYDSKFAKFMGGGIQGFLDNGSLDAAQFSEQLRRNFQLHLSPAEVSALMHVFDIDGNGSVDCAEFIYTFFRMGRNERDRHIRKNMSLTAKLNEEERVARAQRKAKFEKYALVKMVPSTKEDKKRALKKISKAATFHWGDIGGGKSFESAELTPAAFKEQLKRQFLIRLTPGELDAMMKIFDTNNDGAISSVEFVTTFFRIGMKGKRKLLEKKRAKMKELAQKEINRLKQKKEKAIELVQTKIDWPELPIDINNPDGPTMPFSPIARGTAKNNDDKRRPRKPPMSEFLKTIPKSTIQSIDGGSVADLFPRASDDTKDFIKYIEQREAEIIEYERMLMSRGSSRGGFMSPNKGGFKISMTDGSGSYSMDSGFNDDNGLLPPIA